MCEHPDLAGRRDSQLAGKDLSGLGSADAGIIDTLSLVLALRHVELLGKNAAACDLLGIILSEPVMKLLCHAQTFDDLGVHRTLLLGAPANHTDRKHTAIQSATDAAGLTDADRHTGGHADQLARKDSSASSCTFVRSIDLALTSIA